MKIKDILKTTLATLLISSSISATQQLPDSIMNSKIGSNIETVMKTHPKIKVNKNNYGCVKPEWGMHEPIKSYGYTTNFYGGESINFCFPESNEYMLSLITYTYLGIKDSYASKLINHAILKYGEPKIHKEEQGSICNGIRENYIELLWENNAVKLKYSGHISTGSCGSSLKIELLDKRVLHNSYESDTGA